MLCLLRKKKKLLTTLDPHSQSGLNWFCKYYSLIKPIYMRVSRHEWFSWSSQMYFMFLMLIVYIYYVLTYIHSILYTDLCLVQVLWETFIGRKVLLSEVEIFLTIYVFALLCVLMVNDLSSNDCTFVSWFYNFYWFLLMINGVFYVVGSSTIHVLKV